MKYLLPLLLLSAQVQATVSCFSYGEITNCSDGTTAIDFGNMRQIISPNGQDATVYQYGDMTLISPADFAPTNTGKSLVDDTLSIPSLQDQPEFE